MSDRRAAERRQQHTPVAVERRFGVERRCRTVRREAVDRRVQLDRRIGPKGGR